MTSVSSNRTAVRGSLAVLVFKKMLVSYVVSGTEDSLAECRRLTIEAEESLILVAAEMFASFVESSEGE